MFIWTFEAETSWEKHSLTHGVVKNVPVSHPFLDLHQLQRHSRTDLKGEK